jgi:hypothetical protein
MPALTDGQRNSGWRAAEGFQAYVGEVGAIMQPEVMNLQNEITGYQWKAVTGLRIDSRIVSNLVLIVCPRQGHTTAHKMTAPRPLSFTTSKPSSMSSSRLLLTQTSMRIATSKLRSSSAAGGPGRERPQKTN